MGIEDIQISEELETSAAPIKYRGNEGPKSPQDEQKMMMAQLESEYEKYVDDMMDQGMEPMTLEQFLQQVMAEGQMAGGQPLPNDPTKPVNPFQPKPTGPVLPDRQMAAYGGIMGLDGRKQYGIGSWFQKNVMDPIKIKAYGIEEIPGQKASDNEELKAISQRRVNSEPEGYESYFDTLFKGKKNEEGVREGGLRSSIASNIIPIIGGAAAGLFTKGSDPENPGTPDDNTALALDDLKKSANILDQKQAMAANLNFTPSVDARKYKPQEMIQVYQNAANGGRIGFDNGGISSTFGFSPNDLLLLEKFKYDPKEVATHKDGGRDLINSLKTVGFAMGGRIGFEEGGGIMDLGGMEKDYRAEGGFVPIGREEKADDVPARLSVNEFVFTADAVRNAGGGDIDQGAQVMENMMKNLEQGGQVSEESQGMQGARDMFATSERLGEVI